MEEPTVSDQPTEPTDDELPEEPEPVKPRKRRSRGNRAPRSEAQKAAARENMRKVNAARAGKAMTPAELRKSLKGTLQSAAGALQLAGVMANPRLMYDAEVVANNADELATELVNVAEKNPAMYASLVALVKGSQWAKLGGLFVSIALPIAANHGLLPPETATLVGAEPPPPREPIPAAPPAA
jgi:hypothetical protein